MSDRGDGPAQHAPVSRKRRCDPIESAQMRLAVLQEMGRRENGSKRRFTQDEIAREIGMPAASLQRWLGGELLPSAYVEVVRAWVAPRGA